MKNIFCLLFILKITFVFSQNEDDFMKRLKAINNKTIVFYNVDGVEFSSQTFSNEFSEKGLKKLYKKYDIKDTDVKIKDENLSFNNFYIAKSEKITDNINQVNSYYFVENKNKTVTIIWFGYFNKVDKEFERKYVNRILNSEIPKEVFEETIIRSIDFAGRKIELGSNCYWTNINTVQCPYYGEMNWSVHKSYESAKNSVDNQFSVTKSRKGGKYGEITNL